MDGQLWIVHVSQHGTFFASIFQKGTSDVHPDVDAISFDRQGPVRPLACPTHEKTKD